MGIAFAKINVARGAVVQNELLTYQGTDQATIKYRFHYTAQQSIIFNERYIGINNVCIVGYDKQRATDYNEE